MHPRLKNPAPCMKLHRIPGEVKRELRREMSLSECGCASGTYKPRTAWIEGWAGMNPVRPKLGLWKSQYTTITITLFVILIAMRRCCDAGSHPWSIGLAWTKVENAEPVGGWRIACKTANDVHCWVCEISGRWQVTLGRADPDLSPPRG